MTTITMANSNTRFLGLPKNKTGLFAADTIHDVKPTRNHLVTLPALSAQFRHNGLTNLLLASAEQNHHQIQQYRLSKKEIQRYYPMDPNPASTLDSSNDSRSTNNGIRNGFRPSTVRRPKFPLTTAMLQRNTNYYSESKDSLPKSTLIQSQTSAKLKSEVHYINNKLVINKDSNRNLRLLHSREFEEFQDSALSYSTSEQTSSTSTILTADRIHHRFSSAITNITANTRRTLPTITDTPIQTTVIPASSFPLTVNETKNDNQEEVRDYPPTHAYQIPQQSNVGSESIFLLDPSATSFIKTPSAKLNRRSNDLRSVSCPYYVMYFTNLAMQQRENKPNVIPNKENETSTMRKVPVNSRTSTAFPKRQLTQGQVNTPVSINTYSTMIDDDRFTNSTSNSNIKRFLNKIPPMENGNLQDILQTSSWHHVQV